MNHAKRHGGVQAGVLAFLFVVACTAGGVVIAAYWNRPLYRSTATLRPFPETADGVATVNPMITGSIPLMLQSKRIIDMAIRSDEWHKHGLKPLSPGDYARNIHLVFHPELQTVEVSMLGADPNSASAALTALLESYSSLDREIRSRRLEERINLLDQVLNQLVSQVAALAKQSQEVALPYGSDRLQPTLDFIRSQLEKIESLQLEMKIAKATQNDSATSAPAASGEKGALNASEQRLETLRTELRARLLEVGGAEARWSALGEERASAKKRLLVVKDQIEKLKFESHFDQVFPFSQPDVPREPECRWCTGRVKWGAGLGGGGSLLLVLLIAAFYRHD
jgi:hypothetical protein